MTQHISQFSAAADQQAPQERSQGDSPSCASRGAAGSAASDRPLSSQAIAAMLTRATPATSTAQAVTYPPHANRGGSLRHTQCAEPGGHGGNPHQGSANAGPFEPEAGTAPAVEPAPAGAEPGICPQDDAPNHPPPSESEGGGETGETKKRKSRASATTPEMQAFIDAWFFDWLSVTIPNGLDGTGRLRRAAKDEADPEEDLAGRFESREAERALTRWAVAQGLRQQRVGHGTDGYKGAAHYGASPVEGDRLATIRAGHSTTMPGLEIPGGGGACVHLAPSALSQLGPVNLARADVSFDWSQAELFDALLAYARAESARSGRRSPRTEDRGQGRTFYWGEGGEVQLRVYEKDAELHAKGKLVGPPDPRRVRIEFSFAPHKAPAKAGLARLAAEKGPGALLGISLWVRRMVQHIAVLTGATGENANRLAVSRIERLPVSATVMNRARGCLHMSVRTLCRAAAAEIVAECHGGDWLAAEVGPDEIKAGVLAMVDTYLDASAEPARAASGLGLGEARDIDDEAARNVADLGRWMDRNAREVEDARRRLEQEYDRAVDGDYLDLNRLRRQVRDDHAAHLAHLCLSVGSSPALRALDRSYARQPGVAA